MYLQLALDVESIAENMQPVGHALLEIERDTMRLHLRNDFDTGPRVQCVGRRSELRERQARAVLPGGNRVGRVADDHIARRRVDGRAGATERREIIVVEIAPRGRLERVLGRVLVGGDETPFGLRIVTPFPAEDAGSEVAVLPLVRPIAAVELERVLWAAENIVHGSGDGVCAVESRSAVLHDIDSLNHRGGIVVTVEGVHVPAFVRHAVAVDEAEGRADTKPTDVRRFAVGERGEGVALLRLATGIGVTATETQHRRERVENIRGAGQASGSNCSLVDLNQRGADRRHSFNTRAGDGYLGELGCGGRVVGWRRLLREDRNDACQPRDAAQHRARHRCCPRHAMSPLSRKTRSPATLFVDRISAVNGRCRYSLEESEWIGDAKIVQRISLLAFHQQADRGDAPLFSLKRSIQQK